MENKKSAEAGSNPNELSDEIQKISTTRRILPQVKSSIHNIPQKKTHLLLTSDSGNSGRKFNHCEFGPIFWFAINRNSIIVWSE